MTVSKINNKDLHFNKVMSVSGSIDVRCGDIFEVYCNNKNSDSFSIMVNGEPLNICAKTLKATNKGRTLDFKPLITIDQIDTIEVKEVGVVIIGKRYGHKETLATHGKDALLIEDCLVCINGIDVCCYIEGYLTAEHKIKSFRRAHRITNILGNTPLIQFTEETNQQLEEAVLAAYDVSVKKLSLYHRELILEYIYKTNPMLNFERHHIEDMAIELSKCTNFNDLSLTQITSACQIVINNYAEYMPAFKEAKKEAKSA